MKTKGNEMMTATLTFKTLQDAKDFATYWSRKTLTGHVISPSNETTTVTVYNVDEEKKSIINNYVNESNKNKG